MSELLLKETGKFESWSLADSLIKLIEAADILLHRLDYDGHGHEEILIAKTQAEKYLKESGYNLH